jgi:hypothetical protein
MSQTAKTWAWRLAKTLLAVAILVGIGRQFYHDLTQPAAPGQPSLHDLELRPGWLALSAGLYLSALSLSACYWYRLLGIFGERPPFLKAYRAYFLGQLGKYVPGKAWALLLRGGLVAGPEVSLGIAIITAFYEVLTTMAAGALIAALVFVWAPPAVQGLEWHPAFTGLLLMSLCGVPLLPGVFNFLTQRLANRFNLVAAPLRARLLADTPANAVAPVPSAGVVKEGALVNGRLPRLESRTLAQGLAITAWGWGFIGLSVWAILQGVLPERMELTWGRWAQFTGSIGLAYVAGFLAFIIPSGVGVREYFLRQLLAFAAPEPWIAAAVLLLRLVWTTAELILAAVMLGARMKNEERRTENEQ